MHMRVSTCLPCAQKPLRLPSFPWAFYKDSSCLGLCAWPASPPASPGPHYANPGPTCPQQRRAPISHRSFARATPLPGLTPLEPYSPGKPSSEVPTCAPALLHSFISVLSTYVPGSAPGPGGPQRTKQIKSRQQRDLHPGREKAETRRVSNYVACSRSYIYPMEK